MSTVAVIPARLQSTRLPRKLLLDETGKPLIQYVWEVAQHCDSLDEVIVATDSLAIADVVTKFGGRCEMTGEHPSGTDRVAEVVRNALSAAEIVVNLQGDEPELEPDHIQNLVSALHSNPDAQMATLATPLSCPADIASPSCVKVVCDQTGRSLYFSRSVIPYPREDDMESLLEQDLPWLLHLGLYAYRRDALLQLSDLPPSRLEQLEKLEQLRALEAGFSIQVAQVDNAAVGIDTPDDYARFVARNNRQAA